MTFFSRHIKSRLQPKIHGFSFIELMIASGLGLFLMTAIIQVFTQSQKTVSMNQSTNEIQDKGRSIQHHLVYQLKHRGHQGCLPPLAIDITQVDDIDWDNIQTVTPIAKKLPEAPYSYLSLQAFDIDANNAWLPTPNYAPLVDIRDGAYDRVPRPGSDVLHIQYADPEGINLAVNMSSALESIPIPQGALDIEVGDTLFIGDCSNADIFTVTGLSTNGSFMEVAHELSGNRSASLTKAYETNAKIRKFHASTYFIADSGRKTVKNLINYSLYRIDLNDNLVELADGVDFMHATYTQRTDQGFQTLSARDAVFDPRKVVGVDIGFLVVGLKDVLHLNDTKHYRLPGVVIGPEESIQYEESRFLKAVFSTYVDLKNRS